MSKIRNTSKSTTPRSTSRRRSRHPQKNLTWLWIGLGIVILAAAALLLSRPKSTLPTEISTAQAYEKYQQGALFLDVRTQEEWDQMHIPRSILIPLDELQNHLNELLRDQDIVVVCKSGVRSKEGVTILRQADFTRATCMSGGIQAWIAAGYPLEY
jgi:rhodanese-related sulfurtransferase